MVDYNQIIQGIIYTMYSNRQYIAEVVKEMVYLNARKTKKTWVIGGSRVDAMGPLYARGNVDKVIKEIDSKYDFGYTHPYIERKTLKYIRDLRLYIDTHIQETLTSPIKTPLESAFSIQNVVTSIYTYLHMEIKSGKDIHIKKIEAV